MNPTYYNSFDYEQRDQYPHYYLNSHSKIICLAYLAVERFDLDNSFNDRSRLINIYPPRKYSQYRHSQQQNLINCVSLVT